MPVPERDLASGGVFLAFLLDAGEIERGGEPAAVGAALQWIRMGFSALARRATSCLGPGER